MYGRAVIARIRVAARTLQWRAVIARIRVAARTLQSINTNRGYAAGITLINDTGTL